MLQAALSLRLGGGGAGAGHEQAVELVEHALREYPAVGGARLAPAASAMYMTILNGLNRGGKGAAFDMLAEYLLKSGQLDTRTFGALVSAWLDAIGRRPGATCTDVQRTWDTLQSHAASMTPAYELNRNHYHSAIEAYVRLGDVAAAWNVIRTAMRDAGLAPDLDTFYTLASPLASNTALWAVGKSTVANFNTHYPDVVNAALADKTNTLVVKALLHQAIAKPERT
ncbi:hypothetical protein IWQ56_004626 [Coemansia nantahalensis]|nr:hypothetical protein IWQ56_004626 [Coemansia nantahalensis]